MADNYDDYSKEQLLRLLRERDRRPNFGLVWERDEIDHDLSVNNDFVALDWDAGLSCCDGPQRNLIIEGDNFDALRTLRMTHAGRVKCIYIDPPYNTGNRDFIYNDHFIDRISLQVLFGAKSIVQTTTKSRSRQTMNSLFVTRLKKGKPNSHRCMRLAS